MSGSQPLTSPISPQSRPQTTVNPINLRNQPKQKSHKADYSSERGISESVKLKKYERDIMNLLNKEINPNSYYFQRLVHDSKTRLGLRSSDVYEINKRFKLNIRDNLNLKRKIDKNDIPKSIRLKNYEKKLTSMLNKGIHPNSNYFQKQIRQLETKLGLKSSDIYEVNKKINIKYDFGSTTKDNLIFGVVVVFFAVTMILLFLVSSS